MSNDKHIVNTVFINFLVHNFLQNAFTTYCLAHFALMQNKLC